jgi:hypothetical protein
MSWTSSDQLDFLTIFSMDDKYRSSINVPQVSGAMAGRKRLLDDPSNPYSHGYQQEDLQHDDDDEEESGESSDRDSDSDDSDSDSDDSDSDDSDSDDSDSDSDDRESEEDNEEDSMKLMKAMDDYMGENAYGTPYDFTPDALKGMLLEEHLEIKDENDRIDELLELEAIEREKRIEQLFAQQPKQSKHVPKKRKVVKHN